MDMGTVSPGYCQKRRQGFNGLNFLFTTLFSRLIIGTIRTLFEQTTICLTERTSWFEPLGSHDHAATLLTLHVNPEKSIRGNRREKDIKKPFGENILKLGHTGLIGFSP